MANKAPKMLWVKWRDTATYRGWREKQGCTVLDVESLGWLIEDTKGHLMIALGRSTDDDAFSWAEIQVIPKGMVIEKRVLKYA